MNMDLRLLNHSEFLNQFELKTLDPSEFGHKGHLRIAWLYLKNHNINEAVALTCTGIKKYAESLGAKDKFHLTITNALVRIIAQRKVGMVNSNWEEFLTINQDLVVDSIAVLSKYYSKELLFSEQAKNLLLEPDIKQIEIEID